ncbi:MAG: GNAT family N-acetyltransferase [Hyphomicrobium sp.]|nr:GNAT family N-acetyltransferase [Hyphomicrobium sp.]
MTTAPASLLRSDTPSVLSWAKRQAWGHETAAHAGTQTTHLDLALIENRADFDALEAEWNDLYERVGQSATLFQSFNWLWHWANHFLPLRDAAHGQHLAIVTARANGRLVLIAPLAISLKRGIRRLSWMGDPVSQYGDVLADPAIVSNEDIAATLMFALHATRADVLCLRRVRADAAVTAALRRLSCETTDRQMAPFLDLSNARTFDAYEQRYTKSARKNRKRLRRRLEERGPMAIERRACSPEAGDVAPVAIALKRAWLKEKGLVSTALADPRTEAFFKDALSSVDHSAGVEAAVLRSNGETAAVEIAITSHGRTAIHVIAYGLKFEKCGAGALLMEDSIRHAVERGVTTVDLMAPGDSYKFDWADCAVAVEDWSKARTTLGRAYTAVALKLVRKNLKTALMAMPLPMRRIMASLTGILPMLGLG